MNILDKFYETLIRFSFACKLSTTQVIAYVVYKSCPSDRDVEGWLETLRDKISEIEDQD